MAETRGSHFPAAAPANPLSRPALAWLLGGLGFFLPLALVEPGEPWWFAVSAVSAGALLGWRMIRALRTERWEDWATAAAVGVVAPALGFVELAVHTLSYRSF
jgi:hypothetical protein